MQYGYACEEKKAHAGTGVAPWRWSQRVALSCLKPRNARNHGELEEARIYPPLELLEGAQLSQHLDLRLLATDSGCERIHFCC